MKLTFQTWPSSNQINSMKQSFSDKLNLPLRSFLSFEVKAITSSSFLSTTTTTTTTTTIEEEESQSQSSGRRHLLSQVEGLLSFGIASKSVDVPSQQDDIERFMTNSTQFNKVVSLATGQTVTSDATTYTSSITVIDGSSDDNNGGGGDDDDGDSITAASISYIVIGALIPICLCTYLTCKYRKIQNAKHRIASDPASFSPFAMFYPTNSRNQFDKLEAEEEEERLDFDKRTKNVNFTSSNLPIHNVSWGLKSGNRTGDVELANRRREDGEGDEF
jgi:hypothetical protein